VTTTPPGWYPDPSGAPGQRYFDGTDWTEHRAAGQPVLPQPKKSKKGIILGSVGAVLALAAEDGAAQQGGRNHLLHADLPSLFSAPPKRIGPRSF
jgi:Protein of unknown function (DUF2510)